MTFVGGCYDLKMSCLRGCHEEVTCLLQAKEVCIATVLLEESLFSGRSFGGGKGSSGRVSEEASSTVGGILFVLLLLSPRSSVSGLTGK